MCAGTHISLGARTCRSDRRVLVPACDARLSAGWPTGKNTVAVGFIERGKSKMRPRFLVLVLATAFVFSVSHQAAAFSASFSWSGIPPCGRTSPSFTIRDAPKETESLRFMMWDKDAPGFRHGGSTVSYDGGGHVPEGAVAYIGPCPPDGKVHRYVWRIEALDKDGKVIARTAAEGRFPAQ